MSSSPEPGDVVVRQKRDDTKTIVLLGTGTAPNLMSRNMLPTVSCSRTCLPIDEWSVFEGAHPHALLIGSETSTNAAIARLLPYLRAPLMQWCPRAVKVPTQQTKGTLVIWDVDTLDRTQQEQLLTWMDSHDANVQVISTVKRPMFPLVLREKYLDTLYYRLNIVCLELEQGLD